MSEQQPSDSDNNETPGVPAESNPQSSPPTTTPPEPYEPPRLVKFEKLEKLIVSGE